MSLQPNTIPKDGFAGTGMGANYNPQVSTSGANSTTEDVPLGTKVRYRNTTTGGFGTCIYLQITAGAVPVIAGLPVTIDTSVNTAYHVTGDYSVTGTGAPTAVALGIMTDQNYGWFWCGGVAPDLTTLVGSTETRFSAVTVSATTTEGLHIVFSADSTIAVGGTTNAVTNMGYALATDSTTTPMSNIVLYDHWS